MLGFGALRAQKPNTKEIQYRSAEGSNMAKMQVIT
jgi:hypothetical protein